jgi:hypothetical protein
MIPSSHAHAITGFNLLSHSFTNFRAATYNGKAFFEDRAFALYFHVSYYLFVFIKQSEINIIRSKFLIAAGEKINKSFYSFLLSL